MEHLVLTVPIDSGDLDAVASRLDDEAREGWRVASVTGSPTDTGSAPSLIVVLERPVTGIGRSGMQT